MKKRLLVFGLALLSTSLLADQPWTLWSRGYGPIRPGMTIKQAENLLGLKLKPSEDRPLQPECDYVFPATGSSRVGFMVQDGFITHVSVGLPGVRTRVGAMVGDHTSKLQALYLDQLEIEPHHYQEGAFYYFVWEENRRCGVKFEVVNDLVVGIDAGDESIMLVEGCS